MLTRPAARRVCKIVFAVCLALLAVAVLLEQGLGYYIFLPETARTLLALALEAGVVISLVLGFRLSDFRWLRVTATLLLGILLAASILLSVTTQPHPVVVVDDSGPRTLVVIQNRWELGTDNRLYLMVNPLLLRSLKTNLISTTTAAPFSDGDYTLEWGEHTLTVQYKEGSGPNGVWSTAVVDLP